MSSSEAEPWREAEHVRAEKGLILNTIQVLDEEKENILSEVLRCYVCYELPVGKQVMMCEKGHHCCSYPCHKKIKVCGICRGKLLQARNFVVEQLVNKLGPILGAPQSVLPAKKPHKTLTHGSYPCLHNCKAKMPSFQMLPHLRAKHPTALLENVSSNPYSGQFSLRLSTLFTQDQRQVWSAQVCDMGLFTVELSFCGLDLFGCVRMLAQGEVSSLFRCQLVVSLGREESEGLVEFSVTNCGVCSYLDDVEGIRSSGRCLRMKGEHLLEYAELGSAVGVFVSIWEEKGRAEVKERGWPSVVSVPERHLNFETSRRKRRNLTRKMRRLRLRETIAEKLAQNDSIQSDSVIEL